MANIEIEVIPWLTDLLDQPTSRRIKWSEEIANGASVRSLLVHLQRPYPRLAAAIYSIEDASLTGEVNVILNDRALELAGGVDALLRDGDRLTFVPAYVGG